VSRTPPSPARRGAAPALAAAVPDAELLSRHLQGDPGAFCALFSRHKQRLWAIAILMLGDAGSAADAVRDAMIRAFRTATDFHGCDAVTTWLSGIVVQACLDRMHSGAPSADGCDVMAAMRHLVIEQRSALVLVDMLGFSIAEASSMLGVSQCALQCHCARGRARLLEELGRPAAVTLPRRETRNRCVQRRVLGRVRELAAADLFPVRPRCSLGSQITRKRPSN
jgi:RNA polymerase sigma-70 factor, ECF subfamily